MADLNVTKKSIGKFFGDMQGKQFIIPDYQRPYSWDDEKCGILWNDIVDFSEEEAKSGSSYFLGTIVSCISSEGINPHIIDGQQRIVSLSLMLRAFYRKLEDMNEFDEDVIGLKNQVAPCIWDINPISQKVSDKTKIHIQSLVITNDENEIFHKILESGIDDKNNKDNFSTNYRFFKDKCDEYAGQKPMQWKELCVNILQKCVILPIDCDTSETALTIFSTLNDRGMPLLDSDIFKAQIYKNIKGEEQRKDFTLSWKELTETCNDAKITIDDLFRLYSHVLRAKGKDKTKEIGLRKYYFANKYEKLQDDILIENLMLLARFWKYVNNAEIPLGNDESYTISIEARKFLHCLTCYPNEFWKYAITVFFMKNHSSPAFDIDFIDTLKKLTAFLFAKFIESPTLNAIKDDIYVCCISIYSDNKTCFRYKLDPEHLKRHLEGHSSLKLSKAVLLLDAYLNNEQHDLIPMTFDIEHIFPKKWQDANYKGWSKEDANQYLERSGNKIVLEKRLNIQAGNEYFGEKQKKYAKSEIACVKELSCYKKDDWVKEDIVKREKEIEERITSFIMEHLPN